MKYKNRDKVRIVKYNNMFRGESLYLNMTGKIMDKIGKLNLVKLDYDGTKLMMTDEQLVKIGKNLEIE